MYCMEETVDKSWTVWLRLPGDASLSTRRKLYTLTPAFSCDGGWIPFLAAEEVSAFFYCAVGPPFGRAFPLLQVTVGRVGTPRLERELGTEGCPTRLTSVTIGCSRPRTKKTLPFPLWGDIEWGKLGAMGRMINSLLDGSLLWRKKASVHWGRLPSQRKKEGERDEDER